MKNMNMFGMGFWAGAKVNSLTYRILNLKRIIHARLLAYNYLITRVAFVVLILSMILLKKSKHELEK